MLFHVNSTPLDKLVGYLGTSYIGSVEKMYVLNEYTEEGYIVFLVFKPNYNLEVDPVPSENKLYDICGERVNVSGGSEEDYQDFTQLFSGTWLEVPRMTHTGGCMT